MSLWRLSLQDLVIDSRVTSIRHQPLEGMVRSPRPSQSLRLGFGIDCPEIMRFQMWLCLNICKKKKHRLPSCSLWKRQFGVLYDCHPFSSIFKHTNVHLLKVTSVIWDGFPKLAFLRAFLQGNQQGLHLLAAQHGICHQSILPGGSGSGPSFYRAEDMET